MALLNYSTKVEAEKTAGEIVRILVAHGAFQVLQDFDPAGKIIALSWKVRTRNGDLAFRLPVKPEAVADVLKDQYYRRQVPITALRDGQATRVAWRIIKDWVQAQMALLEARMVEFEEIFLPYLMMGPGETLYQRMLLGGFKALYPGERE